MTAPLPSLVRFFVLSTYAPAKRGARRAEGTKPSPKEIAKKAGIAALVVLVVGEIGGLYAYMSWTSYDALKAIGLQGLMLLNAAITASMLIVVISFLTGLTTYCASKADTNMLALPIPGRDLLGAKMAMTYLADFAFAFLIMAVSAAIYAIKEAPPAGFYFGALLSAIAAPLVPLALVYLLIVPLVSLIRPLRSKNAVMIIGGIVGIAFGLAINLYMQTSMSKMQDPAWVLANFAGPDSLLAKLGAAYPPAFLAWKSMTSGGLLDPLYGLGGLALGLGFAALAAIGLGGPYAKSLLGFDEMRIKRVAATKLFFERSFRRGGELRALFLREWRLMNREPVYFMNGPFIVLLMPVFLAVGLFVVAQKPDAIAALGPLLRMKDEPWLMLAAAGFGAFLGSSTSITCTALSRDAKALRYLKALPLSYRGFMLAKFLHGLAFGAIGAAIGGIGLSAIMGLSALDAAAAFLIGLAFSAFASIAGLWLDTANPRTDWDTPMAALKQNPNAMVVILGVMGAIGGLGAASAFLGWGKLAFFAAYFGFFSAATAALLAAYPKFAQRRLEAIEL